MYFLMNKNTIVATYDVKPHTEFSDRGFLEQKQIFGELPLGFKDINAWIDGRKASKHNNYLQAVMKQLGCDTNEGFVQVTHAATINDTFWMKSDWENVSWEQISLYHNSFSETISKLAFEGIKSYDVIFSAASPELACDGTFRKCFRKESEKGEFNSDIFLYKRGGDLGAGLEPYCEQMASEIARIVSPNNAVNYDLVELHDKTASRCNLFTNEKYGYASFAKVTDVKRSDLQEVFDYFANLGSEQEFREMLVIDSLCFNQDRHSGNYGVLFDNDTLEIVKMSPVFDLNISLLPYVMGEEFLNIGDKLFEYAPKLGHDFTRIGQMGMNTVLRDRVKDMKDFSFTFRGDDLFTPERVKVIETVVRRQAEAILSNDKLYTKDVFFSPKAQALEEQKIQAKAASKLMNKFADRLEEMDLGLETFISVCDTQNDVLCIIENGSCSITVDFLNEEIRIEHNVMPISLKELKENNQNFYNTFEDLYSELKIYLREAGSDKFSDYFLSNPLQMVNHSTKVGMPDEGTCHEEPYYPKEKPCYQKNDLVNACEKKKIQELNYPSNQQNNMGLKRPAIDDE